MMFVCVCVCRQLDGCFGTKEYSRVEHAELLLNPSNGDQPVSGALERLGPNGLLCRLGRALPICCLEQV